MGMNNATGGQWYTQRAISVDMTICNPEVHIHREKSSSYYTAGNEGGEITCVTVLGRLLHDALVLRFTAAAGPSIYTVDTTR